jgi:hypothetical protein
MSKKVMIIVLVLVFILGASTSGFAAKVPAPKQGGEGFKAVSLEEAKKLYEQGATFVACHSHTTDFYERASCRNNTYYMFGSKGS